MTALAPISPSDQQDDRPGLSRGRPAMARGIGLRVLALIVLFSSMVTLVSTLVQLGLDYTHDLRQIEGRLDDIGRSSLTSLAVAVWNVDSGGVRVQLEGILRLPDMQRLEVRETTPGVTSPLLVVVGASGGQAILVRDYVLRYDDRGTMREVGSLRAEASLEGVYDRLREKVVVILVAQGLKTFLVSLFTLYIVHRLITRHLVAIAQFFGRYESHGSVPELRLNRTQPRQPDELDQLVDSFRAMSLGLESAYRELAGANAELEWDIAERQARERELQQALDRLAAANRELERFAFVASHDLQEPLRSIVSFAQLLKRHYAGRLDARADEYIGFVVNAGMRMHALINDLLAYSRLDQTGEAFERVSAARACASALENITDSIRDSGASVTVAELPEVWGDEIQLMQLFQNLLSNAVKFRRPGQSPRIRVTVERSDGVWRFAVADDGIGMEADGSDPFEIFRRQHPAHAYPGTGVGLAICKRIVQRHGGAIWIDSRPGHGTTFHFTLPVV